MALTCRTCSTSNEDFARACTTCGSALPRTCPACGAVNGVDASFCSRCGTRVDDQALSRARARVERLRGYLPRDLSDHFLAAGTDSVGEQRQVTVVFIDLVQSTELIRALGDEAMADLLDELMGGIAGIVNDLEGTVAEIMGDGALCMFGSPVTHEDDAERALRAALAARRFVARLRPIRIDGAERRLEVRIGVNTGLVVMRAIGQSVRLSYTAVGDAVHLTQRLQAVAGPGQIVVSAKTQQLVSSLFRFSEPETFTLKGFDHPQAAVRLLGEQDAVERRPLGMEEAFVGREHDLAELQRHLDELGAGVGGILTIWGEAGIGKSRLLTELHRRAPPTFIWLEGRAISYTQTAPYSIIGQEVRRSAGIQVDDSDRAAHDKLRAMVTRECGPDQAATVYPFVATALGMHLEKAEAHLVEGVPADELQREIFRALRTLISATARRAPLVLVFEDLHWSDRASIAAIDALLPLAEDDPILYVLVARPDTEAPSWALLQKIQTIYPHLHTHVILGPLSADASATLAMDRLGTNSLPIELRELVLRKAEGVPLFVEELTKSLIEQGALVRQGESWRLAMERDKLHVPDTVQGIILARLDRLEDPLKRVLQVASVVGPLLFYPVLAKVSDANGRLPARLRDLQRLEFIRETRRRPETEYVFKHALIRDVAYQTLLTRQRKELHLRVGEAAESLLGDRLSEFQSVVAEHFLRAEAWAKAADHLLLAGDEATRLYAHADARLQYEKALDALSRLSDTVENRRRRVDTIAKRVAVSYIAERPDLNLARLTEAEALARRLPDVDTTASADQIRLARVHYWMGRIHQIRADPIQAIGYYRQVVAVGRQIGDDQLTAIPSAMIGQALTVQGQWAKARELLAQALPALERSGEWREWCRVVGYLGAATVACGDYHRGINEARRGLDHAVELNDLAMIASNHILLGVGHVLNERMEAVAEAARAAVTTAERAGEQVILYAGLAFRGWAEGRLGRHAAAATDLERSQAIAAGLGRLILSDWFAVGRADVARSAGRTEEALALAEQAVATAHQVGSLFSKGLAHRVWAQALAATVPPRWDEADTHLAASLQAFTAGEARLPAAHTRLVWGRLCRERGDKAAARHHLGKAAAQFAESRLDDELNRTRRLVDEPESQGGHTT